MTLAPSRAQRLRRINTFATQLRRSGRSSRWVQRDGTTTDSVNPEQRLVRAILATEARVPTYDTRTGDVIDEVLVIAGVDIPEWTPLLESHNRYALTSDLGSAINFTRSRTQILADLVFADVDDVNPIWFRVRDRHLRGVSVGALRRAWVDIAPRQSATVAGRRWVAGKRTLRVTTDWIIREASIVIFGGDPGAGTL